MAKRSGSRYGNLGGDDRSGGNPAAEASPELIGELVAAVVSIGDAILFGATRDGGAIRVVLMSGEERESVYADTGEKLDTLCRTVRDHITNNHT